MLVKYLWSKLKVCFGSLTLMDLLLWSSIPMETVSTKYSCILQNTQVMQKKKKKFQFRKLLRSILWIQVNTIIKYAWISSWRFSVILVAFFVESYSVDGQRHLCSAKPTPLPVCLVLYRCERVRLNSLSEQKTWKAEAHPLASFLSHTESLSFFYLSGEVGLCQHSYFFLC